MQEVRRTIEEKTAGRTFEHRMMDYNNLDTTRFADIKSILSNTIERLDSTSTQ